MSWFNKNEYKTYFKQKLKAEKKQFKIALGIEKYRIKKSNCLKYILNQIDLKIDRYIKELLRTGYFIIEDYSLPEYVKRTKFLFFTLRNEREHDKEIFEEVLNEVISFLIKEGYELVSHSTAIGGCLFQKSFYYSYYLKYNV